VKAVDALLAGLVDYAGLFPPAGEGMRDALENYASYRASDDRSALGRFIVPLSRLKELEDSGRDLMRLSVLVAGNINSAAEEMLGFNRRHQPSSNDGQAMIDVVELKAGTTDDIARQRTELPPAFAPYFEIPIAGDVAALVRAVARAGARAKVRTGGVTPESIPPADQVIAFIAACQREGVPFKATAGLHHPIRGSYKLTYANTSPTGTMYGFLNLFVAAALMYGGEGEPTGIAALEESDPSAFAFEDDAIVWRDKRISADQMEASRRDFAISFGSCSFREPIDELAPLVLARSDAR